ncbi:MAG: hypothetical protein HYR84_08895 [Planctomycetes bacterium]|nr:hypothetical protein [Planctomycetota bacterium]
MDKMHPQDATEFMFRRLSEDCSPWAIGVPVLFAFLVVALITFFKEERKLLTAAIGGGIVGVISLIYLVAAYFLSIHRVIISPWLVILIPVMGVALFYVSLMYLRDSRSVHWTWAIFLGMLRTCVYLILATVFLLPGCQHHDKHEYESRVLILFDVSGSMENQDDVPKQGEDPAKRPTRQDEVVRFLTAKVGADKQERRPFVNAAVPKTPLFAYRFGEALDEGAVLNVTTKNVSSYTEKEWRKFLHPDPDDVPPLDLKGVDKDEKERRELAHFNRRERLKTIKKHTDISGACLQMLKLESGSYLQAIIVISDGQSNKGSDDNRQEFMALVNNPQRPVPVFTIGVGRNRVPTSIKIDDVNAPAETRPDDPFKVRVPVSATGLAGQKFQVTIELTRVQDVNGKDIADQTFILGPHEGVFKGAGDQQQGYVEFEVNVQELKKIMADKDTGRDLEGRWQIFAKTPRHKNETFAAPFHVSEATRVLIQKRALRVLLFAGGATREYQFVRTILYREMMEKRMEFCIHNQASAKDDHVDQDVEPDRMLGDFPNTLTENLPNERFKSLSDYDVIIAFDPDWTKLTDKQRELLNKWVDQNAGGLIFVAGPIYSHQLARPAGVDMSKIQSLIPVVLKDARLHGFGLQGAAFGHDPSRPYALAFTPSAKQYDFLKLDETGNSPIAGWNGFFFGDESRIVRPGEDPPPRPRKGFFTYYPVDRIKTATEVVAAFAGPKDSRIGEKTDAFKDQQPFIAMLPFGRGKTMYISSGELWRLRSFKDGFHERLWIKMARAVSTGAKAQKKYGRIILLARDRHGRVEFEAELKAKNLDPASDDLRPTVQVRRVEKKNVLEPDPKDKGKKEVKRDPAKMSFKFDLQAKPVSAGASWEGHFAGYIDEITEPGEYEFKLAIPGVDAPPLEQSLIVTVLNPEKDNPKTNFNYLYQLASPSDSLLKNLPAETKSKIERLLVPPEGYTASLSERGSKRLFFLVENADAIADCLVEVPSRTDTVKGRWDYLWDQGFQFEFDIWVFLAILLIPLTIGLLGGGIMTAIWEWSSGLGFLMIFGFLAALGTLLYVLQLGWEMRILAAVIVAPLIIGAVGGMLLLILRQWISAGLFFGAGVVIALLALMFAYLPEGTLWTVGALAGLGAAGYAIYGTVTQDYFGLVLLGVGVALAAGVVVLLAFQLRSGFFPELATSVANDWLKVGFSSVLVLTASLVGLEWLTRKLLRLA